MKSRITLNTFRKIERAEEAMIRSVMPRTSDASPEPLPSPLCAPREILRASASGLRLVRPLTFTIGEVAHA